jgi:hypothetical protein
MSGASYAWTGPRFADSAAANAGVKYMGETLVVAWDPHGIQVLPLSILART